MSKYVHFPWIVAKKNAWMVDAGGAHICVMLDYPCLHKSHARLIAAAPELLEACEKAEAYISTLVRITLGAMISEDDELISELRTAIAKAKGELWPHT